MTAVLYFTSTGCAPCKALLPKVRQHAESTGLDLRVVDIEEAPNLARDHQVHAVPSIAIGADIATPVAGMRWAQVRDFLETAR